MDNACVTKCTCALCAPSACVGFVRFNAIRLAISVGRLFKH